MTISYTDALRYARDKKVMLPEEFYLLDLNARQYATTVSYLASLDQIRTVINLANKAVESGSTLQDFKKKVKAEGSTYSNIRQLVARIKTNLMQTSQSLWLIWLINTKGNYYG